MIIGKIYLKTLLFKTIKRASKKSMSIKLRKERNQRNSTIHYFAFKL